MPKIQDMIDQDKIVDALLSHGTVYGKN
jgi:hypothetical protein